MDYTRLGRSTMVNNPPVPSVNSGLMPVVLKNADPKAAKPNSQAREPKSFKELQPKDLVLELLVRSFNNSNFKKLLTIGVILLFLLVADVLVLVLGCSLINHEAHRRPAYYLFFVSCYRPICCSY